MGTLSEQIQAAVQAGLQELLANGSWRTYQADASRQLESELAAHFGGAPVLLASSGTAALEIALRASGIGPGDEVVLSAYDYPGNFWAVERSGARPVLVDLQHGWNLSSAGLDESLPVSDSAKIRAVIVSHLHGQLQPVADIRAWCDQRGLLCVEDACQALGASQAGQPCGTQGHCGIFSFGGGKVLSAGRGGGLVTHDQTLLQKARIAAGAGSGPYALSEVQAALVRAQLPWLSQITETCRQYFAAVHQQLRTKDSRLILPSADAISHTAYYQCGWIMPEPDVAAAAAARDALLADLRSQGINAGTGFHGFHRRSGKRCRAVGDLSRARLTAAQTWVLHHQLALTAQWTPRALCDIMLSASHPTAAEE